MSTLHERIIKAASDIKWEITRGGIIHRGENERLARLARGEKGVPVDRIVRLIREAREPVVGMIKVPDGHGGLRDATKGDLQELAEKRARNSTS